MALNPENQVYQEALAALDANSAAERAAGVTEVTEEYLRLNNTALATEQNVSWWRRR